MKKQHITQLVFVVFALVGAFFASTAGAQILGNAALNVERRGHTATEIAVGKVLVVGGENANGVVGQAEVFDPASRTFLVIGTSMARTDHAATPLQDGRVLITGGRDQTSALAATEIFNPADNSFSAGPPMQRARAGHTAIRLPDGRILIAGGDAEGTAEIYDPAAQLFTLTSAMTEPRALHSAALLKDGKILIAGGVDPTDSTMMLESAEIFDPQTGNFSATFTTMAMQRALPTIRVLPDGKVQVIGGDELWSLEMFNPANQSFSAWVQLPPTSDLLSATLATQSRAALISVAIAQNPLMGAALSDPEMAELLQRSDHTLTELTSANQALVAGGVSPQGQALSSSVIVSSSQATVTTDKLDYAPGETVVISGAGWKPQENVSMVLHEVPETHTDSFLSSTADQDGRFTNTDFAPAKSDVGRAFTITAAGQTSNFTAQTAFTDTTATVKIKKVMLGGTSTFTFSAIQVGASGDLFNGQGAISTNGGVLTLSNLPAPDNLTATEGPAPGWTLVDITCDVINTSGDQPGTASGNTATRTATYHYQVNDVATCTFTNVKDGSITVKKVMQGGTGTFTFTGSPSGTISTNNGTLSQTVVPGTYTATEAAPPAGWTLASIVCDDGTSQTASTFDVAGRTATFKVDPGENVTCTFTNAKTGTITIKKVIQGGTGTFTFTGSPSGTISTNNGTLTQTVPAGTYTAAETVPAGWTLTSIVCDDSDSTFDVNTATATFKVDGGENVTCTFTNTKTSTITIKKVMQGGTDTFTFTGSPSGTISTNNGTLTQTVAAGTYTATESTPPTG
ncbi:MAG TPA: kelch repeat-containing protein, partial [Candidatus Binatia bacterium]